jgi:ATP-binding cassette subfamily B protein
MAAPQNTQPELSNGLGVAAWPVAQAADALYALARHAGLPLAPVEAVTMPAAYPQEDLHTWIEQAATRADLQADQTFLALDELDDFLLETAPSLLRLSGIEGTPLLALVGRKGRFVRALGPDLRVHRLPLCLVRQVVRRPFEAAVEGDVETVLDRMQLRTRARSRARDAMVAERLKPVRFRSCWIVRLPPGARVGQVAKELGITRRVVAVVATHVAQYALFVLSWWILGRGVLHGTVDRGWLLGWLLLVTSLIPLRLISTWNQSLAAVSIGAWLRRRLLRGAFMADRQDIQQHGSGQLFGLVVEASALDGLALTGGTFAAIAFIELAIAAAVLWAGAGALPAVLLGGWVALSAWFAWIYVSRRRLWTTERLGMTHHLLESMLGHRTRLVQQPEAERHQREDEALADYIDRGRAMDRSHTGMTAFIPRGWLVLACCALTPTLASGAAAANIAISIGGVLLAHRALQRLSGGLSHLAAAAIAWHAIAPLVRAAGRREAAPSAASIAAARGQHAPANDPIAVARELTFRYRPQGQPVLDGCSLTIAQNTRLLLEGASGAGKTTLGSVLAGLETPESGLLLMGGLDRASLGAAAWRQRVLMAPQAHDNYIVGASLAFNLLMGRRWPAERADLVEAETICRELGLGELIDRLPAGLHQVVGETGWQLSQGERVRVFLARALLQKPELLVLDESFSALDPENVERAARCVEKRAPTTLAIAHF